MPDMVIQTTQTWRCPNCKKEEVTHETRPNRFHPCPRLYGLTAPLVLAGTSCKVEAVLRQDYVNGEIVQRDSRGKPVMSVVTTRDNGQDVAVFAPVARAEADAVQPAKAAFVRWLNRKARSIHG